MAIDDSSEDKKAKGTKKCIIKRKLKFRTYKSCLEATQLEIKHLEKSQIDTDCFFLLQNKTKRIHKKQEINTTNTTKI